ncbi:MAG: FAD-dependent oxidoreductase [Candidatus Helarchaeota archaeon]|nr:FAD-dependent oxidoreductase [Candidatus Helarchaeota archaeon]
MNSQTIDVAVIGGGVAGLSVAISFKRQGLNVLLLEQENEFRKRIKGEVIDKSADIFIKIFNKKGLPESISRIVFNSAKYYTPSTKKYAHRSLLSGDKIALVLIYLDFYLSWCKKKLLTK